jgi:mannose-6-phosphate isomerase-like protein (cupin superfamily)
LVRQGFARKPCFLNKHTMNELNKTDLAQKFRLFHTVWDPHIAAQLNGQQVKLVKCIGPGDSISHDEDVLYLVFKGELILSFKDVKIELGAGEFMVVPRGTPCKLAAARGAEVIIIDPVHSVLPANLNTAKQKLKKI